jgi:hypothetical protein
MNPRVAGPCGCSRCIRSCRSRHLKKGISSTLSTFRDCWLRVEPPVVLSLMMHVDSLLRSVRLEQLSLLVDKIGMDRVHVSVAQ